jgi:hypothetical protein
VIGTSFRPSGTTDTVYLYFFSTSGPFYVEKVNVNDFYSGFKMKPIVL